MRRIVLWTVLALCAGACCAQGPGIFQRGGLIFVPLRYIAEWMGATVEFDAATNAIALRRDDAEATLTLGKRQATINGQPRTLAVAPFEQQGNTYVPLRFVSEALGADVSWDNAARAARIIHPVTGEELVLTLRGGKAPPRAPSSLQACPFRLEEGVKIAKRDNLPANQDVLTFVEVEIGEDNEGAVKTIKCGPWQIKGPLGAPLEVEVRQMGLSFSFYWKDQPFEVRKDGAVVATCASTAEYQQRISTPAPPAPAASPAPEKSPASGLRCPLRLLDGQEITLSEAAPGSIMIMAFQNEQLQYIGVDDWRIQGVGGALLAVDQRINMSGPRREQIKTLSKFEMLSEFQGGLTPVATCIISGSIEITYDRQAAPRVETATPRLFWKVQSFELLKNGEKRGVYRESTAAGGLK